RNPRCARSTSDAGPGRSGRKCPPAVRLRGGTARAASARRAPASAPRAASRLDLRVQEPGADAVRDPRRFLLLHVHEDDERRAVRVWLRISIYAQLVVGGDARAAGLADVEPHLDSPRVGDRALVVAGRVGDHDTDGLPRIALGHKLAEPGDAR